MYIIKLRGLKLISNKNLKRIKFGILLGCLFYFIFMSQIHFPSLDISDNKTENKVKLSLDPIHDLTGTPIFIDNTDPLNDWATFKATYAWCLGDGSSFQPYTIPQVLIDGPWNQHLITIRNSDVYFEITWCDLLNGYSGIYLDNVTNGMILFNNCSGGSYGIYLADSHNNTISNNDFRDNDEGIDSRYSSYNEISSNAFLECIYGIDIADGFSNTIDNNIFSASIDYDIWLDGSSYTNITRNVLDDSSEHSIFLSGGDHNYIAHNEISDGNFAGVYLYWSDYNTVYNNTMHDIIYWDSCGVHSSGNYNNISENIIERCSNGIYLEGDFSTIADNVINTTYGSGIILEVCSNFNVQGNVITNVPGFGIDLLNSESGDVLENLLDDCGFNVDGDPLSMSNLNLDDTNKVNSKTVYFYEGITGLTNVDIINAGQIILYSCYFGDFSNLNLNHCTLGMALYYCESISISDSDFTYNGHSGIMVKLSNYTIITNVNALNNGKGIFSEECEEFKILESDISHNIYGIVVEEGTESKIDDNVITYSTYHAISISGCDNFLIKNNQIERNGASGIHLTQSHFNNISSNTLRYNIVAGIYLSWSSNNYISDNTASYNTDFGIKLTDYSVENNITKNTLTSNYNTSASYDFTSTGLEIYSNCADNFVSENTMRNHDIAINIEHSHHITISNNVLEDGVYFFKAINITFSENLVTATIVYLSYASGCMFIENILNWVNFRIRYNSDYNSFIGNVLSDSFIAFDFEDSSYNKVINNSIHRAGQCFREKGNCIGNVFEGNYCQEGLILPLDIIGALVGSIAVAGVAVLMYLKRRKYMR